MQYLLSTQTRHFWTINNFTMSYLTSEERVTVSLCSPTGDNMLSVVRRIIQGSHMDWTTTTAIEWKRWQDTDPGESVAETIDIPEAAECLQGQWIGCFPLYWQDTSQRCWTAWSCSA